MAIWVCCRESACHERTLVESPGWVARKLKGLVMELSGRHLDLAKAFSQADENRDEQISYQQLVGSVALFQPINYLLWTESC